jgi:type I restriction-modification system DNA methylase subunit
MNPEQARATVVETFRQKFDDTRFLYFIRNLVNHLDESKKQTWTLKKAAFENHVNHFTRFGTYTDPDGEKVDVLVIHLRKDTTLARGRVTLRNFVADYLATGHGQGKAAVIAAFVSPQEDDWRFSFVKLDYTFEKTDLGLITERIQLTPARRYSYLVGQNENCHTAQKQFLALLQADHINPTVGQLEAAFSVEKVTKQFFAHYRELFEKSRDALASFLESTPVLKQHFDERGIECDDFAKKLLGQIVFLYFLQKKGWFGVERGQPWGSGRKDFIKHLFNHRIDYVSGQRKRSTNFFNDILEPLFYEAIASPRTDDDHYYSRFDCRIPFLNGGLFEPIYGYNWVETEILLPDTLFANEEPSQEEGETGTGILDVFDRYNFTVNEAEPLEKEVAVDPEMLGKVFENLLPENIRHASGTYYTPRIIVHYMCQQALLLYLTARAADIPLTDLALFLRLAERFTDFQANETKKHADKRLPGTISGNAKRLDELLATIAVCDPAIGSGAFPVGMMHEIVRARMALAAVEGMPEQTSYQLKRHAIQHSLYGVDIDPGAVEIAKLRLWLSMVVDEDKLADIQPLPNLDYKIMQGNSLLEEFDSVRLLDDKLLQSPDASRESRIAETRARIAARQAEAIRLHGEGPKGAVAKLAAEQDIKRFRKHLDTLLYPPEAGMSDQGELAQQTSWASLKRIQELHAKFFDENSRGGKDRLRKELDALEWNFMEATLREQGREEAIIELKRASTRHRKPFFLWRLHFSEVFQQRGGFDIVIANPPYVRQESIKEFKPAFKRTFECYTGMTDLYVYFFERGVKLLRPAGALAYISSNSFLNSAFGEKLRRFFSINTRVRQIIDFAETKVFEAVTEPCVICLTRDSAEDNSVQFLKWDETAPLDGLPNATRISFQTIAQRELKPETWQLEPPDVLRLLQKLRKAGKAIGGYIDRQFYRGILTGLNEAFLVNRDTRDQLIRNHRSSEKILKPLLRGRDVKRWCTDFSGQYLVKIESSENKVHPWSEKSEAEAEKVFKKTYPAIYEHFQSLKKIALEEPDERGCRNVFEKLQRRDDQGKYFWELRSCAYWQEFEKPKILYQEINRTDSFAFDDFGYVANAKLVMLPDAPRWWLGLFNSRIGQWYLHTFTGVPLGGFLALQWPVMKTFPIPAVSTEQQDSVERLVERILSSKKRDAKADVSALERAIDELVYVLYGLTQEEIKIVEGTAPEIPKPALQPAAKVENWRAMPIKRPLHSRQPLGVRYQPALVVELLAQAGLPVSFEVFRRAYWFLTQPDRLAAWAQGAMPQFGAKEWRGSFTESLPAGTFFAHLKAMIQQGQIKLRTLDGEVCFVEVTSQPAGIAHVVIDAQLAILAAEARAVPDVVPTLSVAEQKELTRLINVP